jgi:hypothetical protein
MSGAKKKRPAEPVTPPLRWDGNRMDQITRTLKPAVHRQQESALPRLMAMLGYTKDSETGSWRHPAPAAPLWPEVRLRYLKSGEATAFGPNHPARDAWELMSEFMGWRTGGAGAAIIAAAAVLGVISPKRLHAVYIRDPDRAQALAALIAVIDGFLDNGAGPPVSMPTTSPGHNAGDQTAPAWNAITAAVPDTLDGLAEAVRNHDALMDDHRLYIGRCLTAAKRQFEGEGAFMDWFEAQGFNFTYQSGDRYRKYARFVLASPFDKLSNDTGWRGSYTRGAAYRLGRDGVPESALNEAWRRIAAGERITDPIAEEIIATHSGSVPALARTMRRNAAEEAVRCAATAKDLLAVGQRVCRSGRRLHLFKPVAEASADLLRLGKAHKDDKIDAAVAKMLRAVLLELVSPAKDRAMPAAGYRVTGRAVRAKGNRGASS